VLSPLLARGFKCIDLAQVLRAMGFEGRHRAIDDMLPNPEIVRRRIVDLCPGLDFGVIMIPARSTLTLRRRRRRPA
jgi:hypothetical protein